MKKILITLFDDDVAPRFDLSQDVLIATLDPDGEILTRRTVVLPKASAEDLCHLIISEEIDEVVCGGVDEEYHQYLTWKRVKVLDSVMGPWAEALDMVRTGRLHREAVLFETGGGR